MGTSLELRILSSVSGLWSSQVAQLIVVPLPRNVMSCINVYELIDRKNLKKCRKKQQLCSVHVCVRPPPLLKTRRYSFSLLQMLDRLTAVADESLGKTDGMPFLSTTTSSRSSHLFKLFFGTRIAVDRHFMFKRLNNAILSFAAALMHSSGFIMKVCTFFRIICAHINI